MSTIGTAKAVHNDGVSPRRDGGEASDAIQGARTSMLSFALRKGQLVAGWSPRGVRERSGYDGKRLGPKGRIKGV